MNYFEAFPLTQVTNTLATIRTTLIFSVVLITVLGGILGLTMSRSVLRPLRRVSNAANGIATGGLDTRLESEGDPDLDQLVRSFNDMANSVQSRIQREERFASDVSHELRSPITALTTAVEVLERRSSAQYSSIVIVAKNYKRDGIAVVPSSPSEISKPSRSSRNRSEDSIALCSTCSNFLAWMPAPPSVTKRRSTFSTP